MPLKTGQRANYSYRQKLKIAKEYNSGLFNTKSLGIKYNLTHRTISRYIKECGFKLRNNSRCQQKYSINENYFDIIDVEDKAYFLGLLYADGCVSKDGSIILSLEEKDLEIIKKFKKQLKYQGNISYIKPKKIYNTYFKRTINRSGQYRLSFRNKHMVKALSRLGCVPAKSLILEFPTRNQVPEHLLKPFIRGYFDGDGSFSFNKNKIQCSITSTINFLTKLKEVLESFGFKCFLSNPKNLINKGNNTTCVLGLSSNLESFNFINWLYLDSNFFLKRKYKKYLLLRDYNGTIS